MTQPNDTNPPDANEQHQAQRQRQVRYLPSNVVLEESSTLPLVLWTIAVVSGIVLLLVVWAALTTVKETAVTFGEVIPTGQVHVIQHLEGGIIDKVLVKDGDDVKTGQ